MAKKAKKTVAKKEVKKSAPKKAAAKKSEKKAKTSKVGKALKKGLKEAVKHQEGKQELRTTYREIGRPIVKDPPEKSTIPEYAGTREELISTIKDKLLQMKEDTLASMKQREEEAREDEENSSGSGGDEADQAAAIAQAEIQKSLSSSAEMKMRQIELALEKIKRGTYGICIDTEEEIEARRLLANPFALRSIAAQEELEYAQRQKKMVAKGGSMSSMDDGPENSSDEE